MVWEFCNLAQNPKALILQYNLLDGLSLEADAMPLSSRWKSKKAFFGVVGEGQVTLGFQWGRTSPPQPLFPYRLLQFLCSKFIAQNGDLARAMMTGLPPLFFQFEETIWISSVSWNVFLLQLKSHCDDFLYTFLFWMQSPAFRVPHSTPVNAHECSQDFLTTVSNACFFSDQIGTQTCQNFHMISFAPFCNF